MKIWLFEVRNFPTLNSRAMKFFVKPYWMGYKRTLVYNKWPLEYKWIDDKNQVAPFIKWGFDPVTGEQYPDNVPRHNNGTDEYKNCPVVMPDDGMWNSDYCSENYRTPCQMKRCIQPGYEIGIKIGVKIGIR